MVVIIKNPSLLMPIIILGLGLVVDGRVESKSGEELDSREATGDSTNRFFNRMDRVFPYFNFVKFPVESCSTALGFGVCLPSRDCRGKGGIPLGTCAQGFGSCCSFKRSCEASQGKEVLVRENSTLLITSEKAPQTPCKFIFPKGKSVCQLRLDFEEFETANAGPSGNCGVDSVTISGASNLEKPLSLCGNLKDQHIYLSYGSSDQISLESALTSVTAKYAIRVSQIRCNSAISVPTHCTQYYNDITGEIRSLNFGQQQLNNEKYTVCIKQGDQAEKIQWGSCSGVDNFIISGDPSDLPITNPNSCTTDFVQIYGGNKQCGNQFTPIETSAKPFVFHVNFDEVETPEPFPCIPNGISDKMMCNNQTSPGVLTCQWDVPTAGTCCCAQVNPLTSDTLNTGFCLQYTQTP